MLIIDQDRAIDRWDTLPDEIRVAMAADETDDTVDAIAKSRGVPENKIPALARVTGYVFMGFIHSDDAAQELQEALGVPSTVANGIATDLKQKLFSKYQDQLDAIYTPQGALPRVIDLGAVPSPVAPAPLPNAPVTTAPLVNVLPKNTPPTVPLSSTTVAPAPFMIHQESAAAPLAGGATDFKLNIPADIFKVDQVRKTPSTPVPPKPVQLEIGSAPLPPKPTNTSFQTKAPESRVVHYTDLRTMIAPGVAPAPMATPAAPSTPIKPPIPSSAAPLPPRPVAAPVNLVPPSPVPVPSPVPPKPPKVVNFTAEEVK